MDNFNATTSQPFFNTIRLSDIEWAKENEKASGLQSIIKKVFEANPTTEISGWQMKKYLDIKLGKNNNILSVRRSISNLKNEDVLIKTAAMRIGDEGKNEHFYILKSSNLDKYVEKMSTGESTSDFANKILVSTTNRTFVQTDIFGGVEK